MVIFRCSCPSAMVGGQHRAENRYFMEVKKMLKINHEKFNSCGLNCADDADILRELCGILEWLGCHNKNYTKIQYNKILDALDIVKALEIVEG